MVGNQAFAMLNDDLIEDEIILNSTHPTITKTYPIHYGKEMKNGHVFSQPDDTRGYKPFLVDIDQAQDNLSPSQMLTLTYKVPVKKETPTKKELFSYLRAMIYPQLNEKEFTDDRYMDELQRVGTFSSYKQTFNHDLIIGTTNYCYMVQGLGEVEGNTRMCYHTFLKVKVTVEEN